MARNFQLSLGLLVAVLQFALAHGSAAPVAPPNLLSNYSCGWVGNSFGGGYTSNAWVQYAIDDIAVHPDGRVFTASPWDEGRRNYSIYKDGKVWENGFRTNNGTLTASFGEPRPKGTLIAILPSKELIFAPVEREPMTVKSWKFTGQATDFAAKSTFAPLGLAVNDKFLALCGQGQVVLYDVKSGQQVRQWLVPSPGKAAFDKAGRLWVISLNKILEFSSQGTPHRTITGPAGWRPVDVTFDAKGRLMVADNGPEQVVRFFSLSPTPKEVSVLGTPGGIKTGVPGEVEPFKFWGLTACGADTNGNYYVAMSEKGSVLRCFGPDKKLRWTLWGLHSMDVVAADPKSDGLDLYGVQEHYALDYAKPPGEQWTLKGYTLDAKTYPQDPRILPRHIYSTPWITYIRGKKFMFVTDQTGDTLAVYRFQGEVAIPCGLLATPATAAQSIPNAPRDKSFIWRDGNGNGKFEANEFSAADLRPWCWWVSRDGTIWNSFQNQIVRYPPQGIDHYGSPIYRAANRVVTNAPTTPAWTDVQRTVYEEATDTMFLSGFTAEHTMLEGKFGTNRSMGPVLACYTNWSANPAAPAWHIVLDHTYSPKSWEEQIQPRSFDVAGDYLFVVHESFGPAGKHPADSRGEVDVYRVSDGGLVGCLLPTAAIGGPPPTPKRARPTIVGAVDLVQGLRAFKRSTGDYLVFVEENRWAKVFFYHWNPGAGAPAAPAQSPP